MVSNLTFETVNDKAPEPSSNGHILYFNIFKLRKIAGNPTPPPTATQSRFSLSPPLPLIYDFTIPSSKIDFHYQPLFTFSISLSPPAPQKKSRFSLSPKIVHYPHPIYDFIIPPPTHIIFWDFWGYFFAVFYETTNIK